MPRIRRQYAGRSEWFEVKPGMTFEVLKDGPVGSRWKVVKSPYDGAGTARMQRLDENGEPLNSFDSVWWNELFDCAKLIEE